MAELGSRFNDVLTIIDAFPEISLVFSLGFDCARFVSGVSLKNLRQLEHIKIEYAGVQPVIQVLNAENLLVRKEVLDLGNVDVDVEGSVFFFDLSLHPGKEIRTLFQSVGFSLLMGSFIGCLLRFFGYMLRLTSPGTLPFRSSPIKFVTDGASGDLQPFGDLTD